jgi:hypothetical protein
MGGTGLSVGEGWARHAGERAEGGPRGPSGGGVRARGRERRGEGLGQIRPNRGGISLFFFFFSISFLFPFP